MAVDANEFPGDAAEVVTGDVVLRDVIPSDLEIVFEHQLDPEATAMAAFPARDRESFMAHWANVLADDSVVKKTVLVDGRVAGNVVCFDQNGKRLVGYWIGKEFWGRGIATAALSEFLHQTAVRPLFAHVAKRNPGSIRVLEKCGFTVVGEDTVVNGAEQVEEYVFELSG